MKTVLRSGVLGLALGMLIAAPTAFAATFNGKINGHGCAHAGTTCPVDRLDPHIVLESDFVLQEADGSYMFIPNVPRSVKVRYVLGDVEVTGTLNERYQSIDVDEFRVKNGSDVKTVWSKAQQRAEYENLYSSAPIPGR